MQENEPQHHSCDTSRINTMNSFVVVCLLVAAVSAGEVAQQAREKRGFLHGAGGYNGYSGIGGYSGGYSGGYGGGYGGYSGGYVAPAAQVVAVNRVVNVNKVVEVPQVVSVRKLVSVPRVITEKQLVSAPSYGYSSGLGSSGYSSGYSSGLGYSGYSGLGGSYGGSYSSGWW